MTVDRKLLWAAYPDLLVMRGVSTLGGFVCEEDLDEDIEEDDDDD